MLLGLIGEGDETVGNNKTEPMIEQRVRELRGRMAYLAEKLDALGDDIALLTLERGAAEVRALRIEVECEDLHTLLRWFDEQHEYPGLFLKWGLYGHPIRITYDDGMGPHPLAEGDTLEVALRNAYAMRGCR